MAFPVSQYLFVFALTSSFRLFLTLNTGFLVMLSLTEFGQRAVLRAGSLKSSKSTVERLVFFNLNDCHYVLPSLRIRNLKTTSLIIINLSSIVKQYFTLQPS